MIKYTGRINFENKLVSEIYWPATSIKVHFTGKEIKAQLKDEKGENYFNIILDADSLRYIKIDTKKEWYTLASNLSDGEHTIELVKRTEWDKGKTWFYGFKIIDGYLLEPSPKNDRVIEFFGNSITAGYAIEDNTGGDSPDSIYTNNYYTYAALTARHFNADLYCTVKSGIGIMISWFPMIMSDLYYRLNPADSLSRWDFSNIIPDIVVVNLFQNDSWLVNMPNHLSFKTCLNNEVPNKNKIVQSYLTFIKDIRKVYPEANIICALGCMDATQKDSLWPEYIKEAVGKLDDDKIHTHFFPFMNKQGHPRIEDHQSMAKSLISFIEKNFEW
jgi:hypothetical protein